MINLRVATASVVTFVALLFLWTKLAEKSYDKVVPVIQEQQKQAREQQQEFSRMIREDMAALGAEVEAPDAEPTHPSESDFSLQAMPSRHLRPIGSWMGICESNGKYLSFAKFDREKYWLWIKNPNGEDIKEKGEYEYLFDSIEFKPDGKEPYTMEYLMITKDGIQLYQYGCNYNLEREDNIKFDF